MGRGIDTTLFRPERRSRQDCDLVAGFVGRHTLEYFVLKTGGATHVGAGMFVSILITIGSLFINWLQQLVGVGRRQTRVS